MFEDTYKKPRYTIFDIYRVNTRGIYDKLSVADKKAKNLDKAYGKHRYKAIEIKPPWF